jgi:hypothetical protein
MKAIEFITEGDVIHGNFGKSTKEVDLNDISMEEADAVIKKVGLNLNIIFNKDFDSKIYETLIDAYMNNIKGTADDSTMRGIISIYQKRGARAGEIPDMDLYEGEERDIIKAAAVDSLVDAFQGLISVAPFAENDQLEEAIYDVLSHMRVEDIVDPEMEHHGQRMGNFASGSVLDVVDGARVIEEVMSELRI